MVTSAMVTTALVTCNISPNDVLNQSRSTKYHNCYWPKAYLIFWLGVEIRWLSSKGQKRFLETKENSKFTWQKGKKFQPFCNFYELGHLPWWKISQLLICATLTTSLIPVIKYISDSFNNQPFITTNSRKNMVCRTSLSYWEHCWQSSE